MAHGEAHVKRRRARTGCLKCRTRRRKCDEEKPRCRNCRTGGHQCQYGTKLSFLEKNAITVPAPLTSPAPSGSSYVNLQVELQARPGDKVASADSLQFVESAAQGQGSSSEAHPTALTSTREILASPSSTLPEYGGLHFDDSDHGHLTGVQSPALPLAGFASQGRLPCQDAHIDSTQAPAKASETSPGAGAYQSALDGLLSLGNDGQPQQSRVQHNRSLSRDAWATSSVPEHVQVPFEPFVTCRHAPQDIKVTLLRNYVYNIAPWLDTGDPNSTFRLRVNHVSQTSQALLDSLLSLSSSNLELKSRQAHRQSAHFEEAQSLVPIRSSVEAVAEALMCVRRFMLTAPFAWAVPEPLSRLNPMNFDMPEEGVELSLSISWLILRMNLSRGLMHNEPVTVPKLLLETVTTPSGRGWSRDLLDYDRQPLLFCAKAINHFFSRNSDHQDSGTRNKVEAWKEISNSLDLWYLNRPQDFKPILDSVKSDSLFPLILFTNPAAVMANQMYHAAMLLLLQCRPRTLRTEAGRSSASPLRHAQRICGIGLNNNDPNGWDFSLLASLYTAARKMTYVPQQEAILSKLKQVSELTGWNLTGLEPHLRQIWNYE